MNKFVKFTFVTLVMIGCVMFAFKSNDSERYDAALQYIISDEDFIHMLKEFNKYEDSFLYKDDELIYKVYPDVLNEFFRSFKKEIVELGDNGKIVDFDFESIDQSRFIDSTLVQYSKSDTANVQIFFSQVEGNLLSAEAFTNISYVPAKYDGYRAIALSNIGMQYLFVFEKEEIIEVQKKVVQYN